MRIVFWRIMFEPSQRMGTELYERDDVDLIDYPFVIKCKWVEKWCDQLRRYESNRVKRAILGIIARRLKYNKNEEICFVHVMTWNRVFEGINYIDILRRRYPNSKHVLDITDIHRGRKLNIECLKKIYDAIWVYEKREADRLDITYVPPRYSKVYEIPENNTEDIDVFFAGHATDRLEELQDLCKYLDEKGVNCYFYITGVEKERRIDINGIKYADSHMNSDETFSYIARSRCMLEIGHEDSEAITARAREAVIYDKKLLTNNKILLKDKYYDPAMIFVYDRVEDIDISFFRSPKKPYNYSNDYSPSLIIPYCKMLWKLDIGV